MGKTKVKHCVSPRCVRAVHSGGAMGCVEGLTKDEKVEIGELAKLITTLESRLGRLTSRRRELRRKHREAFDHYLK